MTMTSVRVRSIAVDGLRGLAIVLMIADHIAIFTGPFLFRSTITRLSMPIFFILAGHLAHRITWRMPAIGLIGCCIPYVIPFVDKPNVLYWYAIFAPIIVIAKRKSVTLYVIIAISLTIFANYYGGGFFGSYEPFGLLSLMALGAIIPRHGFYSALRLPGLSLLASIGRYPISFYVGHLLILREVTLLLHIPALYA